MLFEGGLRNKLRISLADYARKLAARRQTEDGEEVPDPVPMAPPIGYRKEPSMVEHIRNMVRSEMLRREVEARGHESFEDADDFDVEDDPEPQSQYEFEDDFEPPLPEPAAGQEPATEPAPGAAPAVPEPPLDGPEAPQAPVPAAPRAAAPQPPSAAPGRPQR